MKRQSLLAGAIACFLAAALVGWAMCQDFSEINQVGKIEAAMEGMK